MVHIDKQALALSCLAAAAAYVLTKPSPMTKVFEKLANTPVKTKGPAGWILGHAADDMLLAYGDIRKFFWSVHGGPNPVNSCTHFRIANETNLSTTNPVDIHHIHRSADYDKPKIFKYMLGRMLGLGLVTSLESKRHDAHRKLLAPAFSPQSLKFIADAVVPKHGKILIDALHERCKLNTSFQIEKELHAATVHVMADAIFHTKNLSDTESVTSQFQKCLSNNWSWFRLIPGVDSLLFVRNKAIKESRAFFSAKTKETLKELQSSGKVPTDTTSTCVMDYLAFTPDFTLQDILDHSITFMFAGQDTTSISLNWLCYFMSRNQALQQQLYEELCDAIPPNAPCKIDDLKSCRFLELCVKESMRLRSIAGKSIRVALKDDVLPGTKQFVPKGTTIFTNYWVPMHHPDIWGPDAEEFRPERWDELSGEKGELAKLSYIPFSSGRRDCIGKRFAMNELLLLAAVIFRNFKLTWPEGAPEPVMIWMAVLLPKDQFNLLIEARP